MPEQPISQPQLIAQLHALGVQPGGVLLVHCAFSKVKPVEGGPAGLIAALQAALGPAGTLVMPSMSWDDEHPFDPRSTPCIEEMGVVADTFWRQPGVLRSDSPFLCRRCPPGGAHHRPHPVEIPHGIDSPVGRVWLDGQVLLLGIGHPSDTTPSLAELLAGCATAAPSPSSFARASEIARVDGENDHCCQNLPSWLAGWTRRVSSAAAWWVMPGRAWSARVTLSKRW